MSNPILNLPTELNIKITREGSVIRLVAPELGITTTAIDLWEALQNLKDQLSESFLNLIGANDGQINEFVEVCIKGDDDSVDLWLEDARWQRRQRIFCEALERYYPALKDSQNIQMSYPSGWADDDEDRAREESAKDELISTGPGLLWLTYIRKHAERNYWECKSRVYATQRYQRYLDLGFELRSLEELEEEGRPDGVTAHIEVLGWGDLKKGGATS